MKLMCYSVAGRSICLVVTLALLGTSAGCGSRKGTVYGKVTFRGSPVPGGIVAFVPDDSSKRGGTSTINPQDGSYSIEGLPQGEMKITVQAFQAPNMPAHVKMGSSGAEEGTETPKDPRQGEGGAKPVTIPEKYQKAELTDLKLTVTGGSQEYDIKLE